MRQYMGVDWAEKEDVIYVEDDAGREVLRRRVPHTVEGRQAWGRWLDEQRAAGLEVWAAIERPEGRVVDFLLDHGVVVYPINPKVTAALRTRFRMSGARSDPFDARVLASFLRTDHGHLTPLRPSSEAAEELKGLTRDYARQVRHQTRLLNQLTATLTAYYPRALEVCGDLKTAWARAFLEEYPTPAALGQLTKREWVRWAGAHRLGRDRAHEVWAVIEPAQLPMPAHVVRVKARLVAALLEQLSVTLRAVERYAEAVEDFFGGMPGSSWAASLPGGRSGTTVPSLYAELGDARGRWESFRHLQGCSGTVPVTESSGQARVVKFRTACNQHLRQVMQQFAFQSLTKSEWARAYYDRCRQRGQRHQHAVRALAAKWLKIIFVLWSRQVRYDEQHHLAMMARQHLRQSA